MAIPGLAKVAFLWNRATSEGMLALQEIEDAAERCNVRLQSVPIRGADEFADAFEKIIKGRAEALLVFTDSLTLSHSMKIANFTKVNRLPAIFGAQEFVDDGGLMSYGPNWPHMWRRAADLVDKILRGAKPGDIPVEQPTEFDLVINLTTAKALGLTIPEKLLALANEVIE